MSARGRGFWTAIAIVVVVGLLIGYAVATRGGDSPAPASQERGQVEPVREAPDFAGKARNLAEWLRENSG